MKNQNSLRYFDIVGTFSKMVDDKTKIEEMISAGMTGFRFSFSKDSPTYHFKKAEEVFDIANGLNKSIRLIMDLPGSKSRIITDGMRIEKGKKYVFESSRTSGALYVTNYENISEATVGDILIAGDGDISFRVSQVFHDGLEAEALLSGDLTHNRGLVIEGKKRKKRYLLENEKEFLKMNSENDNLFNDIYYSFTDSRKSIIEVYDFCTRLNQSYKPNIIAKIETISGVENIVEILEVSEEILIGRGDLGIHGGIGEFYNLQSLAIDAVKRYRKKVVIGTQLFETAFRYWIPYRAEISDLSNLISRGIDGILLEAPTIASSEITQGIESILKIATKYGQ